MSVSKYIKDLLSGMRSSAKNKQVDKSVGEFKRAREALKTSGKTQSLGYVKGQIKEGSFSTGIEKVAQWAPSHSKPFPHGIVERARKSYNSRILARSEKPRTVRLVDLDLKELKKFLKREHL